MKDHPYTASPEVEAAIRQDERDARNGREWYAQAALLRRIQELRDQVEAVRKEIGAARLEVIMWRITAAAGWAVVIVKMLS
jgi:ribosomal protein S12 methylthiotransferase accessory factor YcaO